MLREITPSMRNKSKFYSQWIIFIALYSNITHEKKWKPKSDNDKTHPEKKGWKYFLCNLFVPLCISHEGDKTKLFAVFIAERGIKTNKLNNEIAIIFHFDEFFFASFVLLLSNNTVDCQMIINFFDGKSTKIKMGFKDFKRIHQGFFVNYQLTSRHTLRLRFKAFWFQSKFIHMSPYCI